MPGRDDYARAQQIDADARASRIASLIDQLRCQGHGGMLAATAGVIGLGETALPAIVELVRASTTFTADNDPYGEHDFGIVTYGGERLLWTIDYYDVELQFSSPDPTDASVTTRVPTIMLAEEY